MSAPSLGVIDMTHISLQAASDHVDECRALNRENDTPMTQEQLAQALGRWWHEITSLVRMAVIEKMGGTP
jgi:hypothetical protein